MRKFNPDKELNKIKNGNKKKVMLFICALLVVGVLGYSFALYQVRHTKSLVYTVVTDFKKRDIILSVMVDGKTQSDFPKNNEGKIYMGIQCDKEYEEAYFDNIEWKFHFSSKGPNKCTVKFEAGNLPNAPELYQGMIPIVYRDNGLMYVADTNSDWYNYQDHRWANAVLVDASNPIIKAKYFKEDNSLRDDIAGKEVDMSEVLQMYVWIPRYKYQLFNAIPKATSTKQVVNIKFESGIESTGDITCTYTNNHDGTVEEKCVDKEENPVENGDWYTHPAFTFKGTFDTVGTELKGIWVGKFEPSDPTDLNGRKTNSINEITILPDKTSIVDRNIKTIFSAEQAIVSTSKYNLKLGEIDTHPAKNTEWGAVVYLTQSVYGIYKDDKTCNITETPFKECEPWRNNTAQGIGNSGVWQYGGTYTGCVGNSISESTSWNTVEGTPAKCIDGNKWNENGVKASTTGNIYGIYDATGGAWETVMGYIINSDGTDIEYTTSGFTVDDKPSEIYYDIYTYSNKDMTTHERGHLGDATREYLQILNINKGCWENSWSVFPSHQETVHFNIFLRGGRYDDGGSKSTIYSYFRRTGDHNFGDSFRSILTAKGSNE